MLNMRKYPYVIRDQLRPRSAWQSAQSAQNLKWITFQGRQHFFETDLTPFWNWSTLKGQNLLPHGSKYFPFRVDLFSDGVWWTVKQAQVTKFPPCKKWRKIYYEHLVRCTVRQYYKAKVSSNSVNEQRRPWSYCAKAQADFVFMANYDVRGHFLRCALNIWAIMKTRQYNFDPLKPHFYVVKLGFTGVYIIFLILLRNIDCGYSLKPPRRCGSNGYHNLFCTKIWKISEFFIWKFSFFGCKIFNIFE